MFHHSYSVSEEAQGDADPLQARRQQREEARVNRLKRLQKSRITLGGAYPRWKSLLRDKCFKSHADVAFYLLDSFEKMSSSLTPADTVPVQVSAPAAFGLGASSGTDSDDHLNISREAEIQQHLEHRESFPWRPSAMKSEHELENLPAPLAWFQNGNTEEQNSDACERASGEKDARELKNSAIKLENGDEDEDKAEDFSSTFSVGDGAHTVDLGSPSEVVVDESHLLQLFRSCRTCNQRCRHTKRLEGLKLVVSQSCAFCQSSCEWTNLSDNEEEEQEEQEEEEQEEEEQEEEEADKQPHGTGLQNGEVTMNGNDSTQLSLKADVS